MTFISLDFIRISEYLFLPLYYPTEKSAAIKCPDIAQHLVGTKKVSCKCFLIE